MRLRKSTTASKGPRINEGMPAATTTPRERFIAVRMTNEERQRLKDAAAERSMTIAALVRRGLAAQGVVL